MSTAKTAPPTPRPEAGQVTVVHLVSAASRSTGCRCPAVRSDHGTQARAAVTHASRARVRTGGRPAGALASDTLLGMQSKRKAAASFHEQSRDSAHR